MIFINDELLVRMREQVARALPGTAILKQRVVLSDGAGGFTYTWQAVSGGTVACRLDPLTALYNRVQEVALQEQLGFHYHLTLPHDAPIASDHQVEIEGVAYEIKALDEAQTWRVVKRAVVGRVE